MGVTIIPPVPAFYNHPKSINDIVDHIGRGCLISSASMYHLLSAGMVRCGPRPRWSPRAIRPESKRQKRDCLADKGQALVNELEEQACAVSGESAGSTQSRKAGTSTAALCAPSGSEMDPTTVQARLLNPITCSSRSAPKADCPCVTEKLICEAERYACQRFAVRSDRTASACVELSRALSGAVPHRRREDERRLDQLRGAGIKKPIIGGTVSYDEFALPFMGDEVIGDVSILQYSAMR